MFVTSGGGSIANRAMGVSASFVLVVKMVRAASAPPSAAATMSAAGTSHGTRAGHGVGRVSSGADISVDVRSDQPRIRRVVKTILRIPLETAAQQAAKFVRCVGRQLRPVDVLAQHRGNRVGRGVALERPMARDHLVDDDAERPDVRALVHGEAARLLRRHVGGRAEHDAGHR
jgi:hypothetical protein